MSDLQEPRDGTYWELYFSSQAIEPFSDEQIEAKCLTTDDDNDITETNP